jgi:hypothetical protein
MPMNQSVDNPLLRLLAHQVRIDNMEEFRGLKIVEGGHNGIKSGIAFKAVPAHAPNRNQFS